VRPVHRRASLEMNAIFTGSAGVVGCNSHQLHHGSHSLLEYLFPRARAPQPRLACEAPQAGLQLCLLFAVRPCSPAHTAHPLSYALNRFHNCRQLSNRIRRWTRIQVESQVPGCKSSEVQRTIHLHHEVWAVKGTYVQVCDALRPGVPQRSHKRFLWMPLRYSRPGDGRADRRKTQKFKIAKIEFQKLQNRKTKNFENVHHKFLFRAIDLEIVCCKIVLLF
jgi:hypothetical protein